MQTAKNLFLWNSRSYLRKAIEIPLTYGMELVWSKRRILEVYLNIVEWGPGVYGAEAAARYHFNKSAARLSLDEAALLAAALPAPLDRDAGNPGPTTSRLAARLRKRLDSGPDVRCLSLRVQRVREVEGKSKSGR
jgi:monofunctional biosynthetic peptidoglycan transglycosylase